MGRDKAKNDKVKKITRSVESVPRLELDDLIADVKKRAFEISLNRQQKGLAGDEVSDWVKAEADIKAKYQIA